MTWTPLCIKSSFEEWDVTSNTKGIKVDRLLEAEVGDLMWNWVRVFEREEVVRLLFFLFPPPP